RLGSRRFGPTFAVRGLLPAVARLVDEAVDGGGALTALTAHHARRLASEAGEQDLAVNTFGEVLGERGFAGPSVTEQAEDGGASARRFEPCRGRPQGGMHRQPCAPWLP